ncbi:MAG: PKD domain-containing protein [Flavobacteriales bacterium]|nr:PKD domain-containing protein [Flavobacteriales bacterium]
MRKFYTFILSFIVGIIALSAQNTMTKPDMISISHPYNYNNGKQLNNKTASCTDTVRYPGSKLTGLVEADTMDISTYLGAVSQAYYYSGNGTISGLSAYVLLDLDGVVGNSSPITMTIKVYNIDANNYPTTMIDSAVVQVIDVGFKEQTLMFNSPIAVTDSFAIALEINPDFPANPYYITNTSANGDGNSETLSCVTYLGVWYNAFLDFGGWDMDLMLAPIFNETFTSTYTVASNYTASGDTVCLGNSMLFTNTTITHNNSMFHPSTNSYSLDLGDLTVTSPFDTNYSHTYLASGVYNVDLTATQFGHTNNCIDNNIIPVTVLDTAIANFGWAQGGVSFAFHDSSSFANSYSWDFGDGSPLDNSQNPIHTFPIGNYQVCLTVTDTFGCNSNTFCDSVFFTVGIDDFYASDYVKIYPIPANKYFNVTVPTNYYSGNIIITDVVGQRLKSIAIDNQEKVKVLTEGIASGVYFVSIDYNGERVFTKRIVIDR